MPLLPAVTLWGGHAVQGGPEDSRARNDAHADARQWLRHVELAGTVLLEALPADDGSVPDAELLLQLVAATPSAYVRAQIRDTATATRYLDAGAVKAVVEAGTAPDALQGMPRDRLVLAVPLGSTVDAVVSAVQPLGDLVGGVLLLAASATGLAIDGSLLQLVRNSLHTAFPHLQLACVLPRQVTAEALAALEQLHIDAVVGPALYSGALPLADAITAPLVSDRADGLFPTVVVDELGMALGLVYSSRESIAEAVRLRQGVYQSRKKGLWVKGATSGATQELLRIDLDCDNDALRFIVRQHGSGFCHLDRRTCFGPASGLGALETTLHARKREVTPGSYTQRLFNDPALLAAKLREEVGELIDATAPQDIAWEAADVLYFALVKCVANGVTLADVQRQLDMRARRLTRRPGNAKPDAKAAEAKPAEAKPTAAAAAPAPAAIRMLHFDNAVVSVEQRRALLQRPIIETADIAARIEPIRQAVLTRGDAALIELTERFDRVKLASPVVDLKDPNRPRPVLRPEVQAAIDQAMSNVRRFHEAQLPKEDLRVETMPGVECSRFVRPIERVGLYVPGGSAVLPSTTYMLGVPAQVAGCKQIIVASPPGPNGRICPEVEYIAEKIGASHIVLAGGAQAIFAMAYGTESVPKVDKICGPGNQYVTAAKMLVQNDSRAMVSIDMPAGPSELMACFYPCRNEVVADKTANPAYVASDLLSQAEHGPDSQVVLCAVDLTDADLGAIEDELAKQGEVLPRADIVRQSIPKSFILRTKSLEEAIEFANAYAPEHLIVNVAQPERCLPLVQSAGSVFLGPYSSESCGDYASGTNHTLPTYGYARMYSGVNTATFLKHITAQQISREGLDGIGDTVTTLAAVEGLEAHRNSVAIRLNDIRVAR